MAPARRVLVAVLSAATILTAVGCKAYPEGPAGQVIDRQQRHDPATKASRFDLTVRTADGKQHTFQVAVDDYKSCRPRDAYPDCAAN